MARHLVLPRPNPILMGIVATFLLPLTHVTAREWRDNTGKFSVEAVLTEVSKDTIRLKRSDGKVLVVARSRLSPSDRQWIEMRELTDGLASRNPEPTDDGRHGDVRFADAYDWNDRDRVVGVWDKLLAAGPEAFPELIDHCDDTRYCCTIQGLEGQYNVTVGRICREIMEKIVLAESPWPPDVKGSPTRYDFLDWWKANRDKSWVELQIASTEAALRESKELLKLHSPPEPSEETEVVTKPPRRTASYYQARIERLEELSKTLRDSQEPVVCHPPRRNRTEDFPVEGAGTGRKFVLPPPK